MALPASPLSSHKSTILLALLILSISFVNISVCFSQAAPPVSPGIEKCHELARNRTDMALYREAIQCYEQSFAVAPREDTAVKLGKCYYWLGTHAAKDKQIDLFQKGIDWSKKAIALNPKGAGGHFWLGVNNSKYGEARGILKSLFLVGSIIDSMQQVIAIDPAYEHGGPYRVLGRVYFKLPRFAGGGINKSIENLKKSLEYAPNISTTLLFLAESYIAQKDYQRAQQELNIILSTPAIPGLEPEFTADKEEALRLRAEVNKKLED